MSRKTRKLIWSAPLLAVLAVAVALAIFAVQAPPGAQAQTVEVPGPVEGLKATAKSRNSIELTWGLPKSDGTPTSYRIDHSEDNLVWERFVENTDSGGTANRSYLVTDDVDTDTRRHYRVFAINEAGTGPVSNNPVTAFVAVADDFPPTAPVASSLVLTLSIDPTDSNTVVLNWTKPTTQGSPVTGYTAVEMVDEDAPDLSTPRTACINASACLLADITDVDTITVKDPALITGSTHYYRVTANSAEGNVHSSVKGITLGTVVNPSAPTGLVAVPLANDEVELYWVGPASNGGHTLDGTPMVQGRTKATSSAAWGGWNPITGGTPGVAAEAFNLMLASANVGYWQYQVRVQQDNLPLGSGLNKMSSWSSSSNTIKLPLDDADTNRVPLAPTLTTGELVVETRREQGIKLTWVFDATAGTTDLNRPSNYRIDRSKDGLTWSVAQRDTVTLAQWVDKGLDADADNTDPDWYYRLFPINGSTYGKAASNNADVRAADIPASSLVFSLTATGISTTEIRLNWTRPAAQHDGFDLYMAMPDDNGGLPTTDDGGDYASNQLTIPSNVTTYTHNKGLGPEEKRWYRVVATYKGKAIADGPEAPGTTLPAGNPDTGDGATGTPVDLTAEEAKDSSFTLASDRGALLLWNAPVEAGKFDHTGFMVQRKVDDGDWETIAEDTGSKATHYTDEEEPADDEQRAYRVRSRSVKGQSAWSNVAYYPPMAGMAVAGDLGTPSLPMSGPRAVTVGGIKTISILWDSGEGEERQIVQLLTEDRLFVDSQTAMPDIEAADFDNDGAGITPGTYRVQIVALGMGTDFRNSGTVLVTVQ